MSRPALLFLVLALAPLALAGEDPPVPVRPAPVPGQPPAQGQPAAPPESVPEWARVSDAQKAAAKEAGVPVAFENGIGMRFVLIPAGTFQMGSSTTEEGREEDEVQHEVVLTKPYYVQVTEVTNAQYRTWKGDHDSGSYEDQTLSGDQQPVVRVSWDDAKGYADWLSGQEEGRAYRLPTEAEWEYACRGWTSTRFSYGDDPGYTNLTNYAWYGDNSGGTTHPVGQKLPNPLGLYDMHGNVWEWCQDWFGGYAGGIALDPQGPGTGSARVIRGGCWGYIARGCRSAYRFYIPPEDRGHSLGFRAVLAPGQ
jgi:formylglycine-generating enzyme required for sulfatase activity